MRVPLSTDRRASAGGKTVGPFSVLGRQFVVESTDDEMLDVVVRGYVDLQIDAEQGESAVYRIEQFTPRWHEYGWSVWRDDALVLGEVRHRLVPTLIPSDFARHTARQAPTCVPINGVALVRNGRAVVLAADVIPRTEHVDGEPLDLPAFTAHAMRRGWAHLALDVVPIDVADRQVLSFHRPFAAEPDTPLADVIGTKGIHDLVPASTLGSLAGSTVLGAFVAVRSATERDASALEPASPSAVLRALAAQLSGDGDARRQGFHQLGGLVEDVRGSVLHLGRDLGDALGRLEALA